LSNKCKLYPCISGSLKAPSMCSFSTTPRSAWRLWRVRCPCGCSACSPRVWRWWGRLILRTCTTGPAPNALCFDCLSILVLQADVGCFCNPIFLKTLPLFFNDNYCSRKKPRSRGLNKSTSKKDSVVVIPLYSAFWREPRFDLEITLLFIIFCYHILSRNVCIWGFV
jgi:hypothetical protein